MLSYLEKLTIFRYLWYMAVKCCSKTANEDSSYSQHRQEHCKADSSRNVIYPGLLSRIISTRTSPLPAEIPLPSMLHFRSDMDAAGFSVVFTRVAHTILSTHLHVHTTQSPELTPAVKLKGTGIHARKVFRLIQGLVIPNKGNVSR